MKKPTLSIDWLKPVLHLNRKTIWCSGLTILISCVAYQTAYAASDSVGEITIDGELVPSVLFDHFRGIEVRSFDDCPTTASIETVIDLVVAAKQAQFVLDNNTNNLSIIKDLQRLFPEELAQTVSKDVINKKLSSYRKIQNEYFKYRDFNVSQKDLHDEYQKRVRDRDPYITNLTIVRVLEIKQPAGPDWDEKVIELATLIKQGTPFEEAEARYPTIRSKIPYQADRWVALHSLPHKIDSKTVKAGDVYGLEKILSHENYYDPMLKIYEVKHLSQVRLSDIIFSDHDTGLGSGSFYLWQHLKDKAEERKKHVLMSELWSKYSIAEDGNPIQRVGIYKPCTGF